MHVIELKNTLDRLVNLINHRCTGSPEELAQRLSVSDRTVKRYIALLRELGADIRFCPLRNSYYFAKPVTCRLGVDSDDTHPAKGGGVKLTL